MSLKDSIPNFESAIHKLTSGKYILSNYIKPLLAESNSYLKISSFFSPSVIKAIITELGECFRRKGHVKLIIGIHDSEKLIPILDQITDTNTENRFKTAVQEIIKESLQEFINLLENPEYFNLVFAELVRQDLIMIKIAAVKQDYKYYEKTGKWPPNDHTFHPKVSIFKDEINTVVMTGSINSTNKGFGENIEQASFEASWFNKDTIEFFENVFAEIWEGTHEDSKTLEFDNEVREIIGQIKLYSKTTSSSGILEKSFSYRHLDDLIHNSPLYYHYSYANLRLLPHQYEVYRSALSRWPIVSLIADEVGLGKTIEAGAIIGYLKKFFSIGNTALLVPSSLKSQWQRELKNLFGLDFYIYDSASRSLIFAPNNEIIDIIPNVTKGNYYNHGTQNIIFSWHYLRESANGDFKLTKNDNIEFVIVDEAHGARLSMTNPKDLDSTLLFQFLKHLFSFTQHKLLLTATPFQTNPFDYLALLRLLTGNDQIDDKSLNRIARLNAGQALLLQQKVDSIVELLENEVYKSDLPKEIDPSNLEDIFNHYKEESYIKFHPTTVYAIRNTRDRLKEIGYQFPNVQIDSKAIELSKKQSQIFQLVENYIENYLFSFERILGLKGLGFVKTIYAQRIVSSFKACYDTLTSRATKLQSYIANGYIEGQLIDDLGEEEFESENVSVQNRITLDPSQISFAQTELDFINEILQSVRVRLFQNSTLSDPKIDKTVEIVREQLALGNKIIVFSRFTSTTNFLSQKLMGLNEFSFGRYQGDIKQVVKEGRAIDYDRQTLSDKFNRGEFPVILCSDAASEGLNLQQANVIINVDVPWNPARLLQRFGRVDRFGQKKNELFFYNLFYPNTIEDHMYSRLHRRNQEFRELLGSTPEITSEGHLSDLRFREHLDPNNQGTFSYKNSLINLSARDNVRIHDIILEKLRQVENLSIGNSVITYAYKDLDYSLNELDSTYLDLNHQLFHLLKSKPVEHPSTLFKLLNANGVLFFYCIQKDQDVYPITIIEELLDYLILGRSIKRNQSEFHFRNDSLESGLQSLLSNPELKLINHRQIIFQNSVLDFYNGLSLEETGISIDCLFQD